MNVLESEIENIEAWAISNLSSFLSGKGILPDRTTSEMKVLARSFLIAKGKLDVLQSVKNETFGQIWQQELYIQRNPNSQNIDKLQRGLALLQDKYSEMEILENQLKKNLEKASSQLETLLNKRTGGKRKQTKKFKKLKRKTRHVKN